jgi:hypothetical protein
MSRTAWAALAAAVLAVGIATALAAVLASDEGSTTTADTTLPPNGGEVRGFELPLVDEPSVLALAEHKEDLIVGIAARPGGPVEIAALRGDTPVPTEGLQIAADGREVEAKPCGRGCSRIAASALDSISFLTVRHRSTSVSFGLPQRLPPPGDEIFERALRTMDSLRSYGFTERLSSGRGTVVTRLDVQAPNRLQLRTSSGFSSVIIGRTRWDLRDGDWERGPFPGLDVRDLLMWHEARNPLILGRSANGAWELAAFGRKPVPAWFRLTVEPSGRVSEAEMTAPSHFMLHRYSDFNAGIRITAPR